MMTYNFLMIIKTLSDSMHFTPLSKDTSFIHSFIHSFLLVKEYIIYYLLLNCNECLVRLILLRNICSWTKILN